MKRTSIPIRMALAVGVAALGIGAAPWAVIGLTAPAAAASSASSTGGVTPLPDGWELCILQGVSAPATQANVSDLDEWQAEEGGSTNNTAAYNPFNTARTTDVNNGAAARDHLGERLSRSTRGSPGARPQWRPSCSTPNMAAIAAGLRAGNVSPPPAFLAVVDQSQWCAPSADGTPCYSDTILGATGSLATEVLQQSAALSVFGNVRSDLINYQGAVGAVTGAQQDVTTRNQCSRPRSRRSRRLGTTPTPPRRTCAASPSTSTSTAACIRAASSRAGRNSPFGTPSPQGVIAHQYSTVVASDLLTNAQAATAAAKASLAVRDASSKALQLAVLTLTSDNNTENRTLIRLVADVTAPQKAGACTNAVITEPVANAGPGRLDSVVLRLLVLDPGDDHDDRGGGAGHDHDVVDDDHDVADQSAQELDGHEHHDHVHHHDGAEHHDEHPTTTTTTVPGAGSGSGSASQPVPSANPAGLQDLQGCVVALAPTGSA